MFSRRAALRRLLGDLFVFGILHSVFSVAFYAYTRDLSLTKASLLLIVPFLAMSLTRWYANRFWLFFTSHLFLVAWPFWLPAPVGWKAFIFVFMLICGIYSVAVRLYGGWYAETKIVYASVGINVALALAAEYFSLGAVDGILTGWAFLAIVLHAVYTQTWRVDNSLQILSQRTRQPIKTIVRFNNLILLLFLVLVGAFAFLSGVLPLGGIVGAVAAVILFAARLIHRLLSLITPTELPQMSMEGTTGSMPVMPEARPTALFWIILEQVLYYLISTLLITAAVVGIGYLCLLLYRKFYAGRQVDGELREFVSPDSVLEGLRSAARSLLRRLPAFGWSERERIRRDYYKKIRRHIRRGATVSQTDTTGEIKEKLRDSEDVSELTALYDKARYDREDTPPGPH